MAHIFLGKIPHPSGSMGSQVGGGDPAPVGVDQTKIIGTPNSTTQGPETLDQTIQKRSGEYRESPNANLPAGTGGQETNGPVARIRMPEHDGQKPGEGDITLVAPSTAGLMRPASEGASIIAPNMADRQLSDAEVFSAAEPATYKSNLPKGTQDAYLKGLTKDAMAKPKEPDINQ